MPRQAHTAPADPIADPFRERSHAAKRLRLRLLGARFVFESAHPELLRLVEHAYGALPAQRAMPPGPPLRVQLRLTERASARSRRDAVTGQPPPLRTLSGPSGLLCGIMDAANFVLLSPRQRVGLVAVSQNLLSQRYHARYELLEFAVFTLAARALRLVPLHAGCVGRAGRGVLLIGNSGAGKSTLALHCALQGTEFLAEDAVFVDPRTLLASGIPNFVHVRHDSLSLTENAAITARIVRSPVIQRRSGVAKYELDMRRVGRPLARAPLHIESIVFLSTRRAGKVATLAPLSVPRMLARLAATQPYAAGLPEWRVFRRRLLKTKGYELRRGQHPSESAVALRHLLDRSG